MLGMTVSTAVGICIFCLGFAALNLYIERSAISVCVVYALGARVGNGDVSFSGRKDPVDAHARQPRTQIYSLKKRGQNISPKNATSQCRRLSVYKRFF